MEDIFETTNPDIEQNKSENESYDPTPKDNCFKCDSKNTKQGKTYMEGYLTLEYELLCADCGQQVGYWAYGNWQY